MSDIEMKIQQEMQKAEIIRPEIKNYILANFLPGDEETSLQDDDLLFEGGIIDSAGAMTFVCFLEERYNIQILDEELFPENFASVNHIIHFVLQKLEQK